MIIKGLNVKATVNVMGRTIPITIEEMEYETKLLDSMTFNDLTAVFEVDTRFTIKGQVTSNTLPR